MFGVETDPNLTKLNLNYVESNLELGGETVQWGSENNLVFGRGTQNWMNCLR